MTHLYNTLAACESWPVLEDVAGEGKLCVLEDGHNKSKHILHPNAWRVCTRIMFQIFIYYVNSQAPDD
jgi:hypothetical protein